MSLDAPDRGVRLGGLAGTLGFLARLAQRRVFAAFFDAFGGDGLRPGEFTVLYAIGENPGVRQGVLAAALMIKRAHMAKMVRAFEEAGLVARRAPPDDRRASELRLTAAGRAHVARVAPRVFAHDDAVGAPLTAAERAELIRLLTKLAGLPPADESPQQRTAP